MFCLLQTKRAEHPKKLMLDVPAAAQERRKSPTSPEGTAAGEGLSATGQCPKGNTDPPFVKQVTHVHFISVRVQNVRDILGIQRWVGSKVIVNYLTGFLRSLKTWKSHGHSKCKFQALEKLWKTIFFPKFWKSHGNVTKVASNIIYI